MIDAFYNTVVNVLQACSAESVLRHRRRFFKLWWDQEMNELKELLRVSYGRRRGNAGLVQL